jgi:phosphotransferase system enzyme I (PtsI)
VAVSLRQLRKLKTKAAGLPESAAEEVGYLLDAHLAMLSNSRLVRGVDHRITRARSNAERAVQLAIDEIAECFASMRDAYLAARIEDIRVVGTRLIRNLIKKPYVTYSAMTEGAVIPAEELTPADTALMDPQCVFQACGTPRGIKAQAPVPPTLTWSPNLKVISPLST